MIESIWQILCELSLWLIFGMIVSGILHVFLPTDLVRRRFRGPWGVVQAVALGVPLPLCSCGVIPAGIGLKNDGASNGAAIGFMISTPQTGVDSILVSATFLGWPFAIFKVFVALITGLIGGWVTDALGPPETNLEMLSPPLKSAKKTPRFVDAWNHAVEILRSIWIWLVIGLILSAAINTLIPPAWIGSASNLGAWGSTLVALAIAVPLYVCATASVPIAASLVSAGLPPSAALVFLIAGPATNVTTIGAIYGRFGKRVLAIYLATIISGSLTFGWLFDYYFSLKVQEHLTQHAQHHLNWLNVISAICIVGFILYFAMSDVRRWFCLWTGSKQSISTIVQVQGMHCNSCATTLENALLKNKNVQNAQVNFSMKQATVFGSIPMSEIAQIAQSCGFTISKPSP